VKTAGKHVDSATAALIGGDHAAVFGRARFKFQERS
jgi:hypothetical protein